MHSVLAHVSRMKKPAIGRLGVMYPARKRYQRNENPDVIYARRDGDLHIFHLFSAPRKPARAEILHKSNGSPLRSEPQHTKV